MKLALPLVSCAALALGCALPVPASARSTHPYEIAMVLQTPKGDVEQSFVEYLTKRGEKIHTTEVMFSGRAADQPALIARLRVLKPDLIYTVDTLTTLAVAGSLGADPARFIMNIPVVFTSVSDPVAAGLVSNLQRPGSNVTGVIPLAPMSTQLKALHHFENVKSVGFLYGSESQALAIRDQLRDLCREQGLTLIDAKVPSTKDGELDARTLPSLVADLKARNADFLYLGPETFTTALLQDAVMQAALRARLPTFSALESAVRDHGALFGVVSPAANIGRFAAFKALRILTRTASTRTEPIETLQNFSIVINMPTALRLQVYPPLSLLDAADLVTGATVEPHR